tara:strand:+ start:456 stop:1616 length:1161 start_codon:yes stop_codon:yes gene_type:complete
MANVFSALNKLKNNIFGGPGNTGFTKPPASRVQDIDLQPSPTGLLEVDPFAFSTLSYPMDVQNNFQNGHYMIFYVNVQNKTKYVYAPADSKEVTDARLKGASQNEIRYDKLKAIRTAGKTGAKDAGTGTQLGEGTSGGSGDHRTSSYTVNKGVKSSFENTKRITDSVAMYLPASVEDNTVAGYNDARTGIAGFLVASGLAAQGGDAAAIAKSVVGSMEGILKDTTMRAIGVVGEIFGAEGAEGLAKKAFGEADNPYMEVLFDSMQLRTFTYNFQFAPRNEQESYEVQKIIQLFRFHMAPELRPGVNRYLGLPSTFDIHYMFLSSAGIASENNFYNRIATCVLQDCSVNYTPDGVKSFEDGGPTQTTMKLTFKEIELLTKDKIGEGF